MLDSSGQTVLAGRQLGNVLMERESVQRPNALFCSNDLLARGVIQSLTMLHT